MPHPILTILAGALALCTSIAAHAVGQSIDVQVVDRGTGETLRPIFHKGEWWIAGRPGARYGVTLQNRNGQRTLNVVSVDGVNAISGDTAAWNQTGYVLAAYESTEIDGWRKNVDQVAAFEFTALPDSYAARTGRAANVGVIGIAVFNEKPRVSPIVRPRTNAPDAMYDRDARPAEPVLPSPAARSAVPASPRNESPAATAGESLARADADRVAGAAKQAERLGTGHGAVEESSIRYVDFQRAQNTPTEIVTIHYDRTENLIAMGILPPPVAPVAVNPAINPFPGSTRFVPDPPVRR